MTKGTKIQADRKLDLLCYIYFGNIPTSEVKLMEAILSHSNDGSAVMESYTAKEIKSSLNLSDTAFSTSLHRLSKRGVIKKSGKVITLHPIFNELASLDKLVISFV